MKILEIQKGIFINTDRIDAVEKIDDFSCKVYSGPHIFKSEFSYETILQLLKIQIEQENNTQKQKLNILKTQGFYAG